MIVKMAYIAFFLYGIFTVIGSAMIGEKCSPKSSLSCSTENNFCDNGTDVCTCLYGNYVALEEYFNGDEKAGRCSAGAIVGAAIGDFVFAVVLGLTFVLVNRLLKRSPDGINTCWFPSILPNCYRKNTTDHSYVNDMVNTTQQKEEVYSDVDGDRENDNMRNNTDRSTQPGSRQSEGQYIDMTLPAAEDEVKESPTDQRSQYESSTRPTPDNAVYDMLKPQETNGEERTIYENMKLNTI